LHSADGSEDLFIVYRGYCAPRYHHGSAPVPSPEMEVIVGEILCSKRVNDRYQGQEAVIAQSTQYPECAEI
jgi:hypothetical protein